jgi:hypothetical protein
MVFQNLAKIDLVTSFIVSLWLFKTNVLGWQRHSPAVELRGDRRVQDVYCSSLCLNESGAMQACDGVEVYFHASLTSGLSEKSG